jgi:Transcription factor WhiB
MQPPCTGEWELFFPLNMRNDTTGDKARRAAIVKAKSICQTCPLKRKCLETAIINNENNGIWGGVFFGSRREKYPAIRKHIRYFPEFQVHTNLKAEVASA